MAATGTLNRINIPSNHIHGVYGDCVEELKWVCKMLNMEAEVYV
jgi:hypothetical protein